MAENCEKCKFKAHYDMKPNSMLYKFWHWHIYSCPSWLYFTKQSEEKQVVLSLSDLSVKMKDYNVKHIAFGAKYSFTI